MSSKPKSLILSPGSLQFKLQILNFKLRVLNFKPKSLFRVLHFRLRVPVRVLNFRHRQASPGLRPLRRISGLLGQKALGLGLSLYRLREAAIHFSRVDRRSRTYGSPFGHRLRSRRRLPVRLLRPAPIAAVGGRPSV